MKVTIAKDGVNRCIRVHKLVALTFIPNPQGKSGINHIDGNKHNNKVENLEWATPSENQQHALRTGLRDMKRRRKRVIQYESDGSFIKIWDGYVDIKEKLGFSCQMVCHCCKGRSKTAYGYIWRLADE